MLHKEEQGCDKECCPSQIFQIILGLCVLLQLSTMHFYPSLFCYYVWPLSLFFQFVMLVLHCAFFLLHKEEQQGCEKLHPRTFFYFQPLFFPSSEHHANCFSRFFFTTKLLSFTFCSSWWSWLCIVLVFLIVLCNKEQ